MCLSLSAVCKTRIYRRVAMKVKELGDVKISWYQSLVACRQKLKTT